MRPFSYFTSSSGTGGHFVEILESKFMELLQLLVVQVEVDEAWYRKTYRDVDDAIAANELRSAQQHYISAGYFENRLPRPIRVDEQWYLEEYSDVAAAIQFGSFTSATQHFEREGFKEGRLPSYNWSLISKTPHPATAELV